MSLQRPSIFELPQTSASMITERFKLLVALQAFRALGSEGDELPSTAREHMRQRLLLAAR